MAFRFVAILSVLALASAGLLPQHGHESHHQASSHQVITHHGNNDHHLEAAHQGHISLHHGHGLEHHGHHEEHYDHHEEHHAPAHYQFAYGVKDTHTGDIKEQEEKRDGDHVSGHYSLKEADGTRRVVHYQDNGHGFEAKVERQGHAAHQQEAHHGHEQYHGAVHHISAPVVHKIAVHAAPAHGHHASSFQNAQVHHDSHHDSHYGHHY